MRAAIFVSLFIALASLVLTAPTKRGSNGRITYYSGDMLKNPACGGSAPSDDELICAVPQSSGHKCGDKITLQHHNHKVTVTVRDFCASCDKNDWFDLSKAAFSKLASLEEGMINDILFWKD